MIWEGLLLLAAGVGHLAIWVAIFNQLHATGIERSRKKLLERVIYLCVLTIAALVFWRFSFWLTQPQSILGVPRFAISWGSAWVAVDLYMLLAWCAAGLVTSRWAVWQRTLRRPSHIRVEPLETIRLAGRDPSVTSERVFATSDGSQRVPETATGDWCGDPLTRWLSRVPLNQILEVEVNEKVIHLPDLPQGLEGVTIAHASDFHLTGQMSPAFYHHVIDEINGLQCDLIALTGDLIDKPHCLDWLVPVFGRLTSRHGVFYVLGNHDRRIQDEQVLRGRLEEAGLISVNGRWEERRFGAAILALAGNELPWYPGAEALPPSRLGAESNVAKILLSHSPDQIGWAADHGFDLVLAGHTHGGQIRPPVIGPIVSPSRYGPKYASGEFVFRGTHLHVSRGVAGTHPIRLNCRPEITRICLRGG